MPKSLSDKAKLTLLLVYAAGIPTHMLFTNLAIALLSLLWLVEGGWLKKWNELQQQPWIYLFVIFYGLHLLAHFTYTENRQSSAFDLEVKFSLLLIPVVLAGSASLVNRYRDSILLVFAYTTALWCAAVLAFGCWSTLLTGNAEHLIYVGIVGPFGKHYHYLSMFGVVAILIFLHVKPISFKFESYVRWGLSLLILFVVFLSMARMQIVIAMLTLPVSAYLLYKHHSPNWRQLLTFGIFTVVIFTGLLFFSPIREAAATAYQSLRTTPTISGKSPEAGRTLEWEAAFQVFREASLMGVGPGDVQEFLDQQYSSNQFSEGHQHHLNAHNQFLQTLAGLGAVGFVVLIALLLACYIHFYIMADRLGFLILSVFVLSMSTESALCVNNGVAFFAFVLPLLLMRSQVQQESH